MPTPVEPGSPPRHALAPPRGLCFLTGCGRSGTTILGRMLSLHPAVAFLNDRQELWVRSFPVADVWGRRSQRLPSTRLALTARHADDPGPPEDDRPVGRAAFYRRIEARRDGRPVVIEKLPINNFRLPFLHALAPDAPFINILRHGVEVAWSIAARKQAGRWDGLDGRRSDYIRLHAIEHGYAEALGCCVTPFDLGLLEWRMSVEAAERFFASTGAPTPLRLRYETLLAHPIRIVDQIDAFLSLPPSPDVRAFAAAHIARQNPPAHERPTPPSAEPIAGDLLRRLGYWTSRP